MEDIHGVQFCLTFLILHVCYFYVFIVDKLIVTTIGEGDLNPSSSCKVKATELQGSLAFFMFYGFINVS